MITGINHLTLAVSDLDASFRFYREVLGFRPLMRSERSAYFLAGELWLALVADPHARKAPLAEYTHVAFTVAPADFERVVARLRAAGAERWQENTSEGASYYFLDPSGHKLEVHVTDWRARMAALRAQAREGVELFE